MVWQLRGVLHFLPKATSHPGLQFFLLGERTCANFANLIVGTVSFPEFTPDPDLDLGTRSEHTSWWASFGN